MTNPVATNSTTSSDSNPSSSNWTSRLTSPFCLALAGAGLYWLALPPMRLPWAAYLACAVWAMLIAKPCELKRKEYFHIWLAGALLWLALLQGIRLAFWPLYGGWIALSLYVAVYLPVFVGMARALHWSWRIPLPLAMALAWVGCELIRAYFATGFAACMLAHSQTPWPWMLPIASHLGAYGVSFLVMMMGALIYEWSRFALKSRNVSNTADSISSDMKSRTGTWVRIGLTCVALAMVTGSAWSLYQRDQWLASQGNIGPLARILLIQENMPTQFESDEQAIKIAWNRYEQQTLLASKTARNVDLVVWPESTFTGGIPWLDWDRSSGTPSEWSISDSEFALRAKDIERTMEFKTEIVASPFQPNPPALLMGTDVWKLRSGKLSRYNTALWIQPRKPSPANDSSTKLVGEPKDPLEFDYYAKQHLVMFGEYIPILSYFPDVLSRFNMGTLDQGDGPKSWRLASGATVSASVCFEDVVPQLIQRHVRQLTAQQATPDLLINVTNDAWFRGSSILDHHLNNAILAAVENRLPMLVSANSGISAWIDGDGRLVRSIPRLETGFILAEPIADRRIGWWRTIGDWPARLVALLCFGPWLVGLANRILKNM